MFAVLLVSLAAISLILSASKESALSPKLLRISNSHSELTR
jgi:hypothetical protein